MIERGSKMVNKSVTGVAHSVDRFLEFDFDMIREPTKLRWNKNHAFKGRIGYACLNTLLRARDDTIFCSRTCRLETVKKNDIGHVFNLGLTNARDLIPMMRWNDYHGIKFQRISSEMFPFASHPEVGYKLKDIPGVEEVLRAAGNESRRLGHRLTVHPGQYCQLASPNDLVVVNAIRELEYHCEMLDLMTLDQDSVMIIHMGGVYGNKEETLQRFRKNWSRVPKNVQQRLVLENDEICYNVQDLLPISQELKIPIVLDWHHAAIYPSERGTSEKLVPLINAVWQERGIRVKQHYSESRAGAETRMERRAHSDRVTKFPPTIGEVDLMIEAKDKEQAVFGLLRQLDMFNVPDGLPITKEEQQETNRRAKRQRKKNANENWILCDDGNGLKTLVKQTVPKLPKQQKNKNIPKKL